MFKFSEFLVEQSDKAKVEGKGVSKKAYSFLYQGIPPWQIHTHQPFLDELIKEDDFNGPVLDVGCGTGENALFLAENGYIVKAVDYLDEVIAKAKTLNSHAYIQYQAGDIFDLPHDYFDVYTVFDSATFHGFCDESRARYAKLLKEKLRKGAVIYIIGFSIAETIPGGPRRLSESVIGEHFTDGFVIKEIRESRYVTNHIEGGARALLAKIKVVK